MGHLQPAISGATRLALEKLELKNDFANYVKINALFKSLIFTLVEENKLILVNKEI